MCSCASVRGCHFFRKIISLKLQLYFNLFFTVWNSEDLILLTPVIVVVETLLALVGKLLWVWENLCFLSDFCLSFVSVFQYFEHGVSRCASLHDFPCLRFSKNHGNMCISVQHQKLIIWDTIWLNYMPSSLNPSSLMDGISTYCLHGSTCKWSYIFFVLSIFSHHFLETFKDSNSNLVFLFVTEPINKINHELTMRIITSGSSHILNVVSQSQLMLFVKSTTHPVCTAFAYAIEPTICRTLSVFRP